MIKIKNAIKLLIGNDSVNTFSCCAVLFKNPKAISVSKIPTIIGIEKLTRSFKNEFHKEYMKLIS
ncbi:hypothetical protein MA13_contig00011-0060 [Edwardsiella piscicida]|nr:hypothetical protein QY76_04800 [Edwardsiella sp. EA181011]GAJ68506.1 hypothetical protein MA13_contig00011-0060 [Edwardsiella piscicida]